jgi:5-(carboxyamino)imidazole ribonucleotide synthase
MAAWPRLVATPGVVPHLYGKARPAEGRKMGHATRLLPLGSLAGLADEAALAGL